MVVTAASTVRAPFGRTLLRRATAQTRVRAWRQIGRRHYADGGHAKKSSDLPWIIGSAAVTIPSAAWLLSQGPTKGGHPHQEHHDEDEPVEAQEPIKGETAPAKKNVGEKDSPTADVSASPQDHVPGGNESGEYDGGENKFSGKSQDGAVDNKKDQARKGDSGEGDDDDDDQESDSSSQKSNKNTDEPGEGEDTGDIKNHKGADAIKPKQSDKVDQKKGSAGSKSSGSSSNSDSSGDEDDGQDTPDTSDGEREKDEDGYEKPGKGAPGQINWSKDSNKGPGEQQKGPRKPSETAGQKQEHSTFSGAQNPLLDDDEKSKKGEGLKDTMKIHGTVNSNRPAR